MFPARYRPMDERHENIYLIGPMGSGKTTIGQRVATLLGMSFRDCDRELEKQTGASVSLIFDIEGESGFRERENRMLQSLTTQKNVLVATGGGAILKVENCKLLSQSGLVVYLQTSVAQQFKRLRRDQSRPLLQSGDRERKLAELAAARNPLYMKLADIVFPPHNRSPDVAARQLANAIISYEAEANAKIVEIEENIE